MGSTEASDTNTRKRSRAKLIAQLQAEIEELGDKIQEENAKKKIVTNTSASKIVNFLLNTNNEVSNSSEYTQPIDQLEILDDENQIKYVTKLAAITTNDVTYSLVYLEDINAIRRRYTIKGASTAVPFTLVFDVDEAKKCIETIRVTVQDSVQQEIEPLIKSLDKSKSVVNFLQNFNKYTELRQHRYNVYTSLAKAYPDQVSLSYGYSSVLNVEMSDQFGFKVEWNFPFSGNRISQTIQIFPRISEEALGSDLKNQVKDIPSRFRQLVQTKGPKVAIEIFINLIAGRE